MDTSNARLLYDKLDLTYITENMIGKEVENNWLECKEKSRPNHGALDDDDKKYFAKSLSGFANTSGGVLIFGLEARKKEEIDQIQSIKPISQLRRFESALREHESRLVERPIPNIDYKSIKTSDDDGIMAILIPQSPYVPHRSLKDKEFYLRAGGVFSPLPLTLIEDLFFRRLRPQLKLHLRIPTGNHIVVSLGNDGEVSAKWPHIVLQLPKQIKQVGFELDGFTRLHTWHKINEYRGNRGSYIVYANSANTIIHPQTELPLLRLDRNERHTNQGVTEIAKFGYYLVAENMIPLEGECCMDIQGLY